MKISVLIALGLVVAGAAGYVTTSSAARSPWTVERYYTKSPDPC